ncbi:MAG: hypothetical protein O2930_10995 [Acidobacteria bacterium]|nr:hypothetical protein [Acidobacteriota bacterium]
MMPASALAQVSLASARYPAAGGTITTTSEILQGRLDEIARRSSLWRDALGPLQGTDRRVVVVTPDQVLVKDTPDAVSAETFAPTVIAAVSPLPDIDSEVRTVVVVVNLALLERVHRSRDSNVAELYWDLDRILVHEIYGHALPYLLAGDLSGRCADPEPGQDASDACSIRRENAVREELRLGRRTGYGLESLFLARLR